MEYMFRKQNTNHYKNVPRRHFPYYLADYTLLSNMPIDVHVMLLQLCMLVLHIGFWMVVLCGQKMVEGHSACFGFVSMHGHSGEYFFFL